MRKPFTYKNLTVQTKFLYWTCQCIIVTLFLLSIVIYRWQKQTISETTQKYSMQLIEAGSQEINDWIGGLQNELELLSQFDDVTSADWETMKTQLTNFAEKRHDVFGFIGFSQLDGTYYSTIKGKSSVNIANRSLYKDIVEKKQELSISNPEISATTGQLSFFISVPVKAKNGEIKGVLFGSILFETISKYISRFKVGETGFGWIVDGSGLVIVHPKKELVMKLNILKAKESGFKNFDVEAPKIIQLLEGSGTIETPSGITEVLYYSKIARTNNWTLGIAVDYKEIITPARKVLFALIITGILALCAIILTIVILTRRIVVTPLQKLTKTTNNIASGHLTCCITARCNDEIGEIAMALKKMVEKLREIIDHINTSSKSVAAGSLEISSSSESIASGASQQASSVEDICTSIEQMFAAIQENTEIANQTEEKSNEIAKNIEDVARSTQKSLTATREIIEKVAIISDIASKTDLLAINASIEAASAGEYGKGFAVVAYEIRKLAEISKNAAQEINTFSKANLAIADETSKLMSEIVPEIKENSNMVKKITNLSREQLSGTHQINDAVQQLAQIAQSNSAAAEELATSAEELSTLAEQMKESLNFFKLHENLATDTGAILEEISKYNQEITRLQNMLKQIAESKTNITCTPSQQETKTAKIDMETNNELDADFERF